MDGGAGRAVGARKACRPASLRHLPSIARNADGFATELKKTKINFYEMNLGETVIFRGKQLEPADHGRA